MSNIAKIKVWDVSNGDGIRTSIFFSGCNFHCDGCHNADIWSFNIGEYFDRNYYLTKIKPTITEHTTGISILGGEPLDRNVVATYNLIQWFHLDFPDKNIWLWTGYTYEEIKEIMDFAMGSDFITFHALHGILETINVLIDGRFELDKKDLTLSWRGSSNQRVIDVKKTLNEGSIVCYEK